MSQTRRATRRRFSRAGRRSRASVYLRSAVSRRLIETAGLVHHSEYALVNSLPGVAPLPSQQPRNAIDSTIAGDDWGNGTNATGKLEKLHVQVSSNAEPYLALRPLFFGKGGSLGPKSPRAPLTTTGS